MSPYFTHLNHVSICQVPNATMYQDIYPGLFHLVSGVPGVCLLSVYEENPVRGLRKGLRQSENTTFSGWSYLSDGGIWMLWTLCDCQSSLPVFTNTPPQTATACQQQHSSPARLHARQPSPEGRHCFVSYRRTAPLIHPQLLTRSPPATCMAQNTTAFIPVCTTRLFNNEYNVWQKTDACPY